MNSDVTPCAWICILKPPVPFCSSAEPLHFLFYNLCAIIDSPVSQWAIHVCTNRIIWLWWWCCRSSGVRPKRIAETETGWEELGGLLGLMGGEERCQWGGGHCRIHSASYAVYCCSHVVHAATASACLYMQIQTVQCNVTPSLRWFLWMYVFVLCSGFIMWLCNIF